MADILLQELTELSHKFGTDRYVLGGGGNTSVKDGNTMWVKPSGRRLSQMDVDSFVAIDREKLSRLYEIQPPDEPFEREAFVAKMVEHAVINKNSGRASVEAPLHGLFSSRFVVHTHPAIINGLTCSKNGREIAAKLFPKALWIDYVDPGYILCREAKRYISDYVQEHGCEPEVVFLKNHGIFVAADNTERIVQIYDFIFDVLCDEYDKAEVGTELPVMPLPEKAKLDRAGEQIYRALREKCSIKSSGLFDYAEGPVSPDHIVYARSYPFVGRPSPESVANYRKRYGYPPRIFVFADAVFGVASSDEQATLALELAKDGALVKQLAQTFGGIEYMTERARKFIENWEAESYRAKQLR